jgi:hypothetical protein
MSSIFKDFVIRSNRYLIILSVIWIVAMILQERVAVDNFWFPLITNIIVGIPLGVLTGWIASSLYSDLSESQRFKRAYEFYAQFVGEYEELKVDAGKNPVMQWSSLTISQEGLDLVINFNKRIDEPNLPATMRLFGTAECKAVFEGSYSQESGNDFDEGYWGKYDISLYEGVIRGHKYHIKENKDGRAEHVHTRIIWKRKSDQR